MTERADGFAPPPEAATLYVGKVMHARMKPVAHRFSYSVFSLLIDLDRLAEAGRRSPLFRVNRRGVVSFHEADHGPRDGTPLRRHVERLLAAEGVDIRGGSVRLLCYPRVLGYGFNPLAVYFAYDAAGALAALVYEVRNTFGEHHTYVAPLAAGEASDAGVRQERRKLFYVSPFNDLAMDYRFRVRPPQDTVALRILETDVAGPVLAATFQGARRVLTTQTLVSACLSVPLLTFKVMAGIHWEALRLWLKGLRLVERPPAPPPVSAGNVMRGLQGAQPDQAPASLQVRAAGPGST